MRPGLFTRTNEIVKDVSHLVQPPEEFETMEVPSVAQKSEKIEIKK